MYFDKSDLKLYVGNVYWKRENTSRGLPVG